MYFADFNVAKRTDEGFRNRVQPIHHHRKSILEDLRTDEDEPLIDMIKQFPTSDPLHLIEVGVMKRMLRIWTNGSTIFRKKWSKQQQTFLSYQILLMNKVLPSDIHRKVRGLQFIKFWKTTEFRTFMLYFGIVTFKDLLDDEEYFHFLQLCLGVRICSSKVYVQRSNYIMLARELFSDFCNNFVKIYGKNEVVSNIHNVIHIIDDVEQFGSLNETSTYPFENFLHDIKLRIQASNTPIQQIARRLAEMSFEMENNQINLDIKKLERAAWSPELKYEFKMSNESVFKFIRITPNVFLSIRKPGDRWFLTKLGEVVEMKYAKKLNNSYFIFGAAIQQKNSFFSKPYSSEKTDIFLSNGIQSGEKLYCSNDVKAKMICLPYRDR